MFDLHVSKIPGYSAQYGKGIKGVYITYLLKGMKSLFGNCKINLLLQYTKDRFLILACTSRFLLEGVYCYFRKSMDIASVIFGRAGVILGRKNAQNVH